MYEDDDRRAGRSADSGKEASGGTAPAVTKIGRGRTALAPRSNKAKSAQTEEAPSGYSCRRAAAGAGSHGPGEDARLAPSRIVIAVDTNLLVYGHRSTVPEHRRARQALERAANDRAGWGISLPVLGEFWSIVTHAKAVGGASTPTQAASFIRALATQGEMRIWAPGIGFAEQFLEHAVKTSAYGARIFDLQIALIAAENGARELWTHDVNFVRLPGLRIRDPL